MSNCNIRKWKKIISTLTKITSVNNYVPEAWKLQLMLLLMEKIIFRSYTRVECQDNYIFVCV